MSEKWNADEISKFLEMYEEYECLWNIRHSDYMNRSKRDVAINVLAQALVKEGLHVPNVEFLRKKIKVIKNVYRQELLKIEKSKKSGAGLDDIYQPRLSWFKKADAFLRNVTVSRASSSNLVSVCYSILSFIPVIKQILMHIELIPRQGWLEQHLIEGGGEGSSHFD